MLTCFFVINGLFVIPSVRRLIGNNTFLYISFLEKKLIRFLPLGILASAVSLGLGYFLMLQANVKFNTKLLTQLV